MAQSANPLEGQRDCQLKLKLPAECFLFSKIMQDNCGGSIYIVQPTVDQTKSITFTLSDGEVPKRRCECLKVKSQCSPESEGCVAKAVLTFKDNNANSPKPDVCFELICKMFKAFH